jgi:putative SOS response-associated peptidase YedK
MLQPSDAVALRIYPVNRYVNDVRRDGPELIEPLETVAAAAAEGTFGI